MDPATIAALGSIAAPLLGKLFGGGDEPPQSDELERLLRMQRQRMTQAQPLHDAVLRLAMGLMPQFSQMPMGQGGSGAPYGVAKPRTAVPRQQGY